MFKGGLMETAEEEEEEVVESDEERGRGISGLSFRPLLNESLPKFKSPPSL